tara:strand:+ start:143 stop:265 length:123 start_codon:yes stop_codon:yes gene_type:complete
MKKPGINEEPHPCPNPERKRESRRKFTEFIVLISLMAATI